MKIMLETTEWSDRTPNHVYVFTDNLNKIMAYVKAGTKQVIKFRQPIDIDRRGRTFVDLDHTVQDQTDPDLREVRGSRGEIYYVSSQGCSCPGFTFRGKCRHLAMIDH